MRLQIAATLDYRMEEPVDVLLAIEAAPMADQQLIEDMLTIDGAGPLRTVPAEDGIGRRTWLEASGDFRAEYRAIIDVQHDLSPIANLGIAPRRMLPAHVVPYLWPSRYCEADRFEAFVTREFAEVEGGAKVLAMAEWIRDHLDYCPGSSDGTTTAVDSFVSRQGVCRDYAHLLASFARAAGIPARLVSAYAWQLDPPDFHAVVEVWLEEGWHLVDPTDLAPREGLVRIAVGRDATDIAFMTVFGSTLMNAQSVVVERID